MPQNDKTSAKNRANGDTALRDFQFSGAAKGKRFDLTRFDPAAKPGVSNLLEIVAVCTGSTPQELADKYTQYGPLKTDAGDAVIELLRPIQGRYNELMTDRGELASLLHKGAGKAGHVAAATLDRAYSAIGFLPR